MTSHLNRGQLAFVALTLALSTTTALAADSNGATQVFWGNTHLHTKNSGDAILFGARLGPEEAFRFARGDKVKSTSDQDAQLDRPLDFLVVSDHAEGLGTGRELLAGNPLYMADPTLKRWHDMMLGTPEQAHQAARELISAFAQERLPPAMNDPKVAGQIVASVWQEYIATAESYNQPGKFTTLLGYEYTSTPKGNNLHRIVIFRDGAERVGKILPFSSLQSQDPEKLWAFLGNYEEKTGGKVLAIPHNGDLSNGLMYSLNDYEGRPMTADYAKRRARWEPLTEVTQIKGDSETHPYLSPTDEFGDFGHQGWDQGNLDLSSPKKLDMLAGDYVRSALKRGVILEKTLGTNPYKLGMIGATDAHNALSSAGERIYFGEEPGSEPNPTRAASVEERGGMIRYGWQRLSGGYTAVWARENTREALFDAMLRKEVYATTGTRLTLRFFGGWDYSSADLKGDVAELGYTRGVPMGGDLTVSPKKGGAPTFILSAMKDPTGANLDRLQVVKGWVDAKGQAHEKIFNVAWSDPAKRHVDSKGRLAAVGDTVDLTKATYDNSIGAAQLSKVWKDPEFNPAEPAFYYVRALEIPTPRWPAYDAVRFGVKPMNGARLKDQQRAYSSPIWYEPKN